MDSALYFYHKAEVLFDKIQQLRGYTSTANNIGLIYLSLSQTSDALTYFNRVLSAFTRMESRYFESVAYQNSGTVFTNMHADSAEYYFKKAIEIQKAENNLWGLAKSYYNISSVLYNSGNPEEAITYLNKAITINEKLENYHALASNYYQLSQGNTIMRDFEQVEKNLKKALQLSSRYTDDDLKQKIEFELALVKVRKYDKALSYSLEAAVEIRDSLHLTNL